MKIQNLKKDFKLINSYILLLKTIFDSIYSILTSEELPNIIKTVAFKYLLALVTQIENLNDNLFLEHFMQNNSLFEAIIQVS
jgi:hypothetical protein